MLSRTVLDPAWPEDVPPVSAFADEVRRAVSNVGGGFTLAFLTLDPMPTPAALAVASAAAGLTRSPHVELTHDAAHARLESLLERDLAYDCERVPYPHCSRIAEAFLARFSANARFFSNGEDRSSWTPLTDSAFDGGVVVVDADRAGVLWVEDGD